MAQQPIFWVVILTAFIVTICQILVVYNQFFNNVSPPISDGDAISDALAKAAVDIATLEKTVNELRLHGDITSNVEEKSERADNNVEVLHVVDSIMYNGEMAIQYRLQMLYDVVDRFYISENKRSHSGVVKERLFKDINTHLFAPYEDKISWVITDDLGTSAVWGREKNQRNAAVAVMKKNIEQNVLHMPFVIINTDADEIPDPEIVRQFQPGKKWHTDVLKGPVKLDMNLFYYNYNWLRGKWTSGHVLPGDAVLSGKWDLNTYRVGGGNLVHIPNAGWHGSFFMSVDDIVYKLQSFAHQEFNKPKYTAKEHIINCIENGKDIFMRSTQAFSPFDYKQLPLPLQAFHESISRIQNQTAINKKELGLVGADIGGEAGTFAGERDGATCPLDGSFDPPGSNIMIDYEIIRSMDKSPLERVRDFTTDKHGKWLFLDAGSEHYPFLNYLSATYGDCRHFTDIGTREVASALALGSNLKTPVWTFDIPESNERLPAFRGDTEENYQAKAKSVGLKIKFHNLDLMKASNKELKKYLGTWFVMLDTFHKPDTVPFEREFFQRMLDIGFKGILGLDDIHLNSQMEKWWKEVQDGTVEGGYTTYDISEIGHFSGTGLVDFSGKVVIKR